MATVTSTDVHFAAALAAAAELAKNGGAYLLTSPMVQQELQLQSLKVKLPQTSAVSSTVASTVSSTVASPLGSLSLPSNIAALLSSVTAGSSISTEASSAPCKQHDYATDDEASDVDDEDEDDAGSNNEKEAKHRIARSRERNREHARRTRLRKKAQLQDLQSKVKGLQAESKVLKQSLEECSIASILVGLSSGERDATIQSLLKEAAAIESKEIFQVVAGKRKRFLSDASSSCQPRDMAAQQVLEIKVSSKTIKVGGGRSQINWKNGFYMDEDGVQRQLTYEQLESLRRERNRMHAKMTRDRKKTFIAAIQTTIQELEANNKRMRAVLADVVHTHFKTTAPPDCSSTTVVPVGVTPTVSPAVVPRIAASIKVPPLAPALSASAASTAQRAPDVDAIPSVSLPTPKRVCHGFSLKI